MNKPIKWMVGLVIPMMVALGFLNFGNPQSNKWIFVWQAYVYPVEEDLEFPPAGYEGYWQSWTKFGAVSTITHYDGVHFDDFDRSFYNGFIHSDRWLNSDFNVIIGCNYNELGEITGIGSGKSKPDISYQYGNSGNLILVMYNGKPLTTGTPTAEQSKNLDEFEAKFQDFLVERTKLEDSVDCATIPEANFIGWRKRTMPINVFPNPTKGVFTTGKVISNSVEIMGDKEQE